MANKEFGKQLKMYRSAAMLTQEQVAEALGINRTTYTYYETGKTEPSIDMLAKITKLFNVSYDSILPSTKNPKYIKDTYFDDNGEAIYNLSKEEQSIILKYRLSDEQKKNAVKEILS